MKEENARIGFVFAVKTFLKFLLCVLTYTIVLFLASALLPYSQEFLEFSEQLGLSTMAFMLVPIFWNCFTAYFIVKHANFCGRKLFAHALYVMFFVIFFITYVFALYSVQAFYFMTWLDMILPMFSGLFALLAMIPLMIKLFKNEITKTSVVEHKKLIVKDTLKMLGLCALVYLGAYAIFMFGIQWQFVEFRAFYADTTWAQTLRGENFAGIVPYILFQLIRGVLNGFFILPMLFIITKSKFVFITAICLIYLAPGINHLLPNPMIPDIVRYLHLVGMTGSMLLFGIVAGNILWGRMCKASFFPKKK